MKTYTRLLALALCATISCGFTWGKSQEEKCVEAKKLALKLPATDSEVEKRQNEHKILELCADGAAGLFVRTLRLEREGKTDQAIKGYRDVLKEDSDFPMASGNLGLIYLQKGMKDEAIVELTKGLSAGDPRYHKELARVFNERKIYPLAIYHYGEAIKGMPRDAGLRAEFAEIYGKVEKKTNAEEEFRKAISLDPTNEKARIGLINLYLNNDQLDSAITELKNAQLANPQNKDIHRMLGEAYEKKGDFKAAEYEYVLAGKVRNVLPDEYIRRGDEFLKKQELDQAIAQYRAALKEKPDWLFAQQKIAEAYQVSGREDETLIAFRDLARMKGADAKAHQTLAELYERKGMLDEAVVEYKQVIQRDGANLEARRRLADIYAQRGSFPQAVEQYRELIRNTPGDARLRHKLAKVYVSSKNQKEALAEFRETVRLDPDNLDAHRELAALYKKNNQADDAERSLKEVLRLKKDDNEARTALTAIYVKDKKYDELITLLKEGVELNPKDSASRYKLGLIYEFKKDYESAITQYKDSVELKNDNAKSLNALGRVYMRTGRFNEAKEALEAAKKADPAMEETAMMLSNIRDELTPDSKYKKSRKGKKGKKGDKKGKKGGKKKSGAAGKKTKSTKKKAE